MREVRPFRRRTGLGGRGAGAVNGGVPVGVRHADLRDASDGGDARVGGGHAGGGVEMPARASVRVRVGDCARGVCARAKGE